MPGPSQTCVRHLPELVAALLASACGDDRASAPPASPPAPRPAERVVAPCTFEAVLSGARVASRDVEGPWAFGQSVFEYLRPSARVERRHVNRGDSGGTSSVGWRGEALTFELPPNTALPRNSLLRHGPPPAIAYRVDVAASHQVAVVACPTDRASPRLELTLLRRGGGVDPISLAPVGSLLLGGDGPHPIETRLWAERPSARLTHTLHLPLEEGDVLRLTAAPVIDAAGTLELAFDVAITPLP